MIGASLEKLCACEERFVVPGTRTCRFCAAFDEGDDRDCPACGTVTANDGSCVCDLNWPRQDSTHWQDR
jgi:hypothetical protein